jgi:hypothetical protein
LPTEFSHLRLARLQADVVLPKALLDLAARAQEPSARTLRLALMQAVPEYQAAATPTGAAV